jgi:hypothetical protein
MGAEYRVEDKDKKVDVTLRQMLKALFGIPLGPGVFPNLRPFMAS